jgi:hypothetical protein
LVVPGEVDVVLLAPVVEVAELVLVAAGALLDVEADADGVEVASVELDAEVGDAADEVSASAAGATAKVIRALAATTVARRPTVFRKVRSRKSSARGAPRAATRFRITTRSGDRV